jgi:glycosyltransferase involved in cell wall biosynthesis
VARHDPPLVGIGLTMHNRADFLCEALDSLLAQSYPHFRLVLVDDGSTDGTEAIARAYEARDARVRYVRFEERRGMIAAWRSAFELATADGAPCFAWASDHDRWHPHWLETLVGELERHPEVVLAYPLTQRMDASGMPLPKAAREFETLGVADLAARWRRFSRSDAVAAGDMVYGLMRPEAARRAGVFRDVLCPDRLLVAELTLQGQIRQVPETLWFRRQFSTGSVARQRSSLFAPGAPRPGVLTPPWYMHARSLWRTYGGPADGGVLRRSDVARMIAIYTAAYAWRHYGKTPAQRDVISMLGRPRWLFKQAKHGALLGAHYTLVGARRVGITPLVERVCERLTGRPRPWRKAA